MATEDFTDAISGSLIVPLNNGVFPINSGVNYNLTNPPAKVYEVTFTNPGLTIFLPPSLYLSRGGFVVINKGSNSFTVKVLDGSVTVCTIAAGEAYFVYCKDTSTNNGTWAAQQFSIGAGGSLPAILAGYGLVANGSKIDVDTPTLAGAGLVATAGNALNVNPDNTTVVVTGDQVKVGVITGANIAAATITADKLSGVSVAQKFTNSSNGMTTGGTMVISTPGVPFANRFERIGQVVEETVGGAASDTTWDFDLADRNNYDVETTAPAANITPSDNGTTLLGPASEVALSFQGFYGSTYNNVIQSNGYYVNFARNSSNQNTLCLYQTTYDGTSALYPANTPAINATALSTTVVSTAATLYQSLTQLTESLFVVTYYDATNTKVVGYSLSETTFTAQGSALTLDAGDNPVQVVRLSNTQALVVWFNGASLKGAVVTTGGGATSIGATATVATTFTAGPLCLTTLTSGSKYFCTWQSAFDLQRGIVIDVSGTTVTFNSVTTVVDKTSIAADVLGETINCPVSATSVYMIYYWYDSGAVTRRISVRAIAISGGAITPGTETNLLATAGAPGTGYSVQKAMYLGSNRIAFCYSDTAPTFTIGLINVTGAPALGTGTTSATSATSSTFPRSDLAYRASDKLIVWSVVNNVSNAAGGNLLVWDGNNTISAAQTTQDNGYDISASANIWTTSALGSAIEGNSGYVRITDFVQNASGGTALSSAGVAANAFDNNASTTCAAGANGWVGYDFGATQTVRVAGLRVNSSGFYNLVFEAATDVAFTSPQVEKTVGQIYLNASQIYWFDMATPQNLRYHRVRETGGATFTVQDVYMNYGAAVRAQTAYVDFASLAAITSGNWTLEPTVFTNGGVAADATDTNEVMITTNSSQINCTNWEDMDSFSSVNTTRVKRNLNGYTLGRGDPVSTSNIYNTDGNQALFAASAGTGAAICRLDDSTFILAYNTGSTVEARVITKTGNVLSAGALYTISASNGSTLKLFPLTSSTALLYYRNSAFTTQAQVLVNTMGSLSAGSSLQVFSGTGTTTCGLVDSTTLFVAGRDSTDSNKGKARCVTIAGTTLTNQTLYQFDATATSEFACVLADVNKMVICFNNTTSASAIVATITPVTFAIAYGTRLAINADTFGSSLLCVQQATTNKLMLAYATTSALTTARFGVLTVSGTNVTLGTETTYTTAANPNRALTPISANRFLAWGSSTNTTSNVLYLIRSSADLVYVVGDSPPPGGMYVSSVDQNNAQIFSLTSTGDVVMLGGGGANNFNAFRAGVFKWGEFSPCLAFSFNARSTWRVWDYVAGASMDIASSLSSVHGGVNGDWYYKNSAGAWVAASPNTQRGALKQAFGVQENRYPVAAYVQLTDAQWNTFGWTKSATSTIDLAAGYDATTSALDGITLGYTSRSQWLIQDPANYKQDYEVETQVTVTKLSAGTNNIKGVVMYST